MFGKIIISASLLIFLVACGSAKTSKNEDLNSTEVKDNNLSSDANTTDANLSDTTNNEIVELNSSQANSSDENNVSYENNESNESNETVVVDMNYTDEERTLSAYERYITHSSSALSPNLISLFFKTAVPVENGTAIIKENSEFSFELNWENPLYAKNVNFYFLHTPQSSIQYINKALPTNSSSFSQTCTMLEAYRFKCSGVVLDDSKYYVNSTLPMRSSFVMAVCDRSTQDPNRVCDFIRIPVEFRE